MPLEKPSSSVEPAARTVFSVLIAISFFHLLNDAIQSLIPAIYPIVKESFHLTFTQVGLITLTFQMTASLLQPAVGFHTDRNPKPFSLAIGMTCTLVGLVCLAFSLFSLIFSKYFYLTSITSYYTFYLLQKFQISVASAQLHLFLFLFAVAAGTLIGSSGGSFLRGFVHHIIVIET